MSAEPGLWAHIDAAPSGEFPAAAMTGKVADPAPDSVPGAGRLVAGSIESSELVSLLALRLPADCFGMCGDGGTVVFASLITFIWEGE
jgi:hypothetical protein